MGGFGFLHKPILQLSRLEVEATGGADDVESMWPSQSHHFVPAWIIVPLLPPTFFHKSARETFVVPHAFKSGPFIFPPFFLNGLYEDACGNVHV